MTRCSNGLKILTALLIAIYVWSSPKNMTRFSNGLKILTALLITICMKVTEEYDKVLKWSQNTHNSTHTCMYGIHPKNMTRCSNGLKILTTLLIAICMEFTEEYDKVLKWSQNTHSSTHSYICMEFTEEYDKVLKWSQNTHSSTNNYMYESHRRI